MSVEKLSKTRREAIVMAGLWLAKYPSATTNQKNAFWLKPVEVEPCVFCLTLSIFSANKTISPIPTDPMLQPCLNPLHGFITPCCPQITDGENPESTPKHPTISPTAHLYRLNHRSNHKNHVKPYKNPQYYHFVQCGYCNFTNET